MPLDFQQIGGFTIPAAMRGQGVSREFAKYIRGIGLGSKYAEMQEEGAKEQVAKEEGAGGLPGVEEGASGERPPHPHTHYSHRAAWLRAFVLGANDGLVSTASLMLGVGGGSEAFEMMKLAGVAGWIAGALSMACGEYISVSSQKDCEEADIQKEIQEQAKGPEARAAELEELAQIYADRGLTKDLARQVAEQLTAKDLIRAHARDELNIDLDDLANPLQASVVSSFAFSMGAAIPLLAGCFIEDHNTRIFVVAVMSAIGLAFFGFLGAMLGGAKVIRGTLRVLTGGMLAMAATYGVGKAFNVPVARRALILPGIH